MWSRATSRDLIYARVQARANKMADSCAILALTCTYFAALQKGGFTKRHILIESFAVLR